MYVPSRDRTVAATSTLESLSPPPHPPTYHFNRCVHHKRQLNCDMRADVNSVVWGTLDIFEQTFVFWGILGNSPLYTVRKLTTHHYL